MGVGKDSLKTDLQMRTTCRQMDGTRIYGASGPEQQRQRLVHVGANLTFPFPPCREVVSVGNLNLVVQGCGGSADRGKRVRNGRFDATHDYSCCSRPEA